MNSVLSEESSNFGARLAHILRAHKVSQSELADRVGVTRPAMSRYVSGEREPRMVTILQIASALDIQVDELLGGRRPTVDGAIAVLARSKLTPEQKEQLRKLAEEKFID